MSASKTYLAVFLGSKNSPGRVDCDALPEGDRRTKEREGMTAWKAWERKAGSGTREPATCHIEL